MKKIKTFAPMYLFGILFCGIIAVVFYFVGVQSLLKLNNIIKNGTETTALVVDYKESNAKINNESTYHFVVTFFNKDGEQVQAATIDFFTEVETYNAIGEEITIRYIGKDVVHGDDLFGTAGIFNIVFSVGCVVLALLAALMLVFLIKTIFTAIALNGILKSGTPVTAHFSGEGKRFMMGRTSYYSVIYEYTDMDGNFVTKKSPKNYTANEVSQLKSLGSFEVKVNGNKSIISHEFN